MLPPTNGMVILSREEQPEKAALPIIVTLFGIVILVKPLQLLNAFSPILVTALSL